VDEEWQEPQEETVYLITSLTAAVSPQALLSVNCNHWGIEITHRNKDVILGEDGYTNRSDNAQQYFLPHRHRAQNPEVGFTLANLGHRALSGQQNRAIRLISSFH
jgi:hypothetical protein